MYVCMYVCACLCVSASMAVCLHVCFFLSFSIYVCMCVYVCGPHACMICHKIAAGGGRSASPAANKLEEAWPSAYHLVSMCFCMYVCWSLVVEV